MAGAGDPSEATALDLLDAQLAAAPGSYRHPECRAEEVLAGVEVCVVGDPAAERTVLVVGDSHAGQWKPALDELGRAEGVRVVEHLIPNCPAIGVEVTNRDGDADRQAACAAAWDERRDLLGEVRPDVVLVAQWAGYLPRIVGPDGARPTADEAAARWQDAYEELVATVEASGAALVVVLDEPTLDEDPVTCIDEAGLEACTPTRDGALAATVELRDAELAALDGAPDVRRVDLVDVLCDAETCTLRSRDALVFADRQHLTESFVVSHPELVTEPVLAALADGGG